MRTPNLHLNLLRDDERRSSSPVRIRVMLPVFALLALAGCLVWWGAIAAQTAMVRSQLASMQADVDAKKKSHADIIRQMTEARDLQAELDQLSLYGRSRRVYGEAFARLADVMPENVQLISLEIPEQPKQNLLSPGAKPGAKVKPLLGPTNTIETVTLRLAGRTENEKPVLNLLDKLAEPAFSNVLKVVKTPGSPEQSPRIHSFRQDASSSSDERRLLTFDVEYTCRERRFEK